MGIRPIRVIRVLFLPQRLTPAQVSQTAEQAVVLDRSRGRLAALDNLIAQAAVTVDGALARTESRGAHAREDFPRRDDAKWMKHTLAWADTDKRMVKIGTRPVHNFTLSNEIEYIPPVARQY